jgi:hypothetical protein
MNEWMAGYNWFSLCLAARIKQIDDLQFKFHLSNANQCGCFWKGNYHIWLSEGTQ